LYSGWLLYLNRNIIPKRINKNEILEQYEEVFGNGLN